MNLNFLLQINTVTDSAAKTATQAVTQIATTAPKATLNLLDMIMKGGVIMIPIFLLLLIAVYIFIERFRRTIKYEHVYLYSQPNVKELY